VRSWSPAFVLARSSEAAHQTSCRSSTNGPAAQRLAANDLGAAGHLCNAPTRDIDRAETKYYRQFNLKGRIE
jgi:hypothetical protein